MLQLRLHGTMAVLSDFKFVNCMHLLTLQLSEHLSRLLELHCISLSCLRMLRLKLLLQLEEPGVLLLPDGAFDFVYPDLFCLFSEDIVRLLSFYRGFSKNIHLLGLGYESFLQDASHSVILGFLQVFLPSKAILLNSDQVLSLLLVSLQINLNHAIQLLLLKLLIPLDFICHAPRFLDLFGYIIVFFFK